MTMRESFEDWWNSKGASHYLPSAKAGLWIVFSDAWYRAQKEIIKGGNQMTTAVRLQNAFNLMMNELQMGTSMPSGVFTIVLTVQPIPVTTPEGDRADTYGLCKIAVNEEIYDVKF